MSIAPEQADALRRISPPLADALERRPDLVEPPKRDDTVSTKVLRALLAAALSELDGADLSEVTRGLSLAMDAIVAQELEVVVAEVAERHPIAPQVPFAVIAMGKWGANELNYYSDIDLVFVHEAVDGNEEASRAAAVTMAGRLLTRLSTPTFEGPTLNVDPDLRPEGTMGPLSRSLEGYDGYYSRWGEAWELQALLKVRPAAGDPDLGERFKSMADRIVWEDGLDTDALRSIRALKARAEEEAGSNDIKRSRGGIRDIEFSVQILQLVHGRVDPALRVASTLEAISALNGHDFIENDEAERLTDAYRFLRDVEHRLQLRNLRQTQILPGDQEGKEWLGRALGFTVDPAAVLADRLAEVRSNVRDLHERLYFRPILDALVGLENARLTRADAEVRLEALGFANFVAAAQAANDLLTGVNRRSQVMQQILPLMLDWLSQSPDPDLGLAQLRLLMSRSTDHAALIRTLQTNPIVGERLCRLLGTGKLVGNLMDRIPEFVPRLASDEAIATIRDAEAATERILGVIESRPERDARIGTIRRFVRRRKLRIAARDILDAASPEDTLASLSDSADAAMTAALHISRAPDAPFGVIAMGRWGGRELSYGSDIDVMYVNGDGQQELGARLATELREILSEPSRHGDAYTIDADLRPEGRSGPISRSLGSFRRYYEEWMAPWELMALVKARPSAGDPDVLSDYFEMVEPLLWRKELTRETINEIRAIKARVESERIPAGEDPDFHLKLGPGGLSDVEFVVQLLQLRHGGEIPELRVTGTFDALRALRDTGVIGTNDFTSLHDAYLFCTRVRLRLHLQSGHPSDSLPVDPDASARLAASLGMERTGNLRELYRRYTRRSRRTFEALFYE